MSSELREKIVAYRQAMSLVRSMLLQAIITEKEYAEIDTILAKKYGLSLGTIFR